MKTIAVLVFALSVTASVHADTWVDISELRIAGIHFRDPLSRVIEVLGDPIGHGPPCIGCIDQPSAYVDYGGLRIWHSYGELYRFIVKSSEYKLRSGIAVGSSKDDVTETFGHGEWTESENSELLTYRISWKHGRHTRLVLEFALTNDTVTEFQFGPR